MAHSSWASHSAEPVHAPAQIAVGDEGYMVGGTSWLDNGSKGDDWVGNLQDPNIAFGTVHLCESPILPRILPQQALHWRMVWQRWQHCKHSKAGPCS